MNQIKDHSEYHDWVHYHLSELGLHHSDIHNILDSTEGRDILKRNFKNEVHPATCVDDILRDAPDYILDQIN